MTMADPISQLEAARIEPLNHRTRWLIGCGVIGVVIVLLGLVVLRLTLPPPVLIAPQPSPAVGWPHYMDGRFDAIDTQLSDAQAARGDLAQRLDEAKHETEETKQKADETLTRLKKLEAHVGPPPRRRRRGH